MTPVDPTAKSRAAAPPSISDVATEAGVSAATVSRALRGLSNVHPDTAIRVREAAARLGYSVSPVASSLATGSTRTIAVLCSRITAWFVGEACEAVVRSARDEGFTTLVFSLGMGSHVGPRQQGRLPVQASHLRRRADAVVVVGLPLHRAEVEELETLGVPLVFIGHAAEGHVSVHIDERETARQATAHLISLGHRRIAHVTGLPDDDSEAGPPILRLLGYEDALREAGIDADYDLVAHGPYTREGARAAARDLLRTYPDVTALLGFSDVQAAGALAAARDLGLRVPEDLSIVGIDGSDLSEVLRMTTMEQDPAQQGEAALSLALESITGGPVPTSIVFPTALVPRETTSRYRPRGRAAT